MQKKLLLLVVIIFISLISSCSAPVVEIGPKKEVVQHLEKEYSIEGEIELKIISDSSNIEVYSWDKEKIKFEIKKRVRGTGEKKELEDKLEYFDIDIVQDGKKIEYEAKYKKGIKNAADIGSDLRVFLPRKLFSIYCKLDIGTITFFDDLETDLSMETNMVNIIIKRLKGKLRHKGDMGNLRMENGIIKKASEVSLNFGNIEIKADYEKNGVYNYKTQTGNIDLQLPKESEVSFENIGTVEVNEFSQEIYPTIIKNSTDMGRITLRKY